MTETRQSTKKVIFALMWFLAVPAALPAQVRVLMSGGFSAAYQELLPQFENTTAIKVKTARGASQGDGPMTIGAQLRRGVPADVVIMSRDGLAGLLAEGRIAAGSDVDLASVPLGVGVRAGTSHPDIGTVEAFKQTLLRAKSIGIQSSSAIYLKTKVFPRLGIESALAGKLSGAGAANVARGEAEMVVLPVSEIRPVSGVDFLGLVPADIQFVQVFAAAMVKGAKDPGGLSTAHRFPGIGQGKSCDRKDGDEASQGSVSRCAAGHLLPTLGLLDSIDSIRWAPASATRCTWTTRLRRRPCGGVRQNITKTMERCRRKCAVLFEALPRIGHRFSAAVPACPIQRRSANELGYRLG